MPSPSLIRTYRRFRKSSPFMLVGYDAAQALRAARTLLEWNELEAQGVVRLRAEPDEDYEPCDCGPGCRDRELYERDGAWGVIGEYRLDADEVQPAYSRSADYTVADSVWGHVGYSDPTSPYENCYVVDIMQATIEAYLTNNAETARQL